MEVGMTFCWDEIEQDVVIRNQPAVAVYTNPNGGIVLRQAGDYGADEDHWVYFDPMHAEAIANAILAAASLDQRADTNSPKDSTAAERQRRYRARKRAAEGVTRNADAVTDRNALRLVATE